MRIIAGEWRGRLLEVPEGIRPMLDRERERLFGVFGERIEGAEFLDVFAGSGAIGLEALSRGARRTTAVENGRRVLPVTQRNIESLIPQQDGGAGRRIRLLPISALSLPKAGDPGPGTVDLAVACPPFPLLLDAAMARRLTTLFTYIARRLVKKGGLFVLEHPRRLDPPVLAGAEARRAHDTRSTASSAISFYDGG